MKNIFVAMIFAAGVSAPAFAQDAAGQCEGEANAIWAAVEQSQLEEDQKSQIGAVLQQAVAQDQAGDAAACMETVDQLKVALGIEPTPQTMPN